MLEQPFGHPERGLLKRTEQPQRRSRANRTQRLPAGLHARSSDGATFTEHGPRVLPDRWTQGAAFINLAVPVANPVRAISLNPKELAMNEKHDTDLEIIDLGDAKEVTMGTPNPINSEDNEVMPERL